MTKNGRIFTKDLPTTNMSWTYVLGEIKELWEEIIKGNLDGMVSEACDVYTCASCAIMTSTGINLPIVWTRTANVWFHRVEVFKQILNSKGLSFKIEYLRYGANYAKPHKVAKVIELAMDDQNNSSERV